MSCVHFWPVTDHRPPLCGDNDALQRVDFRISITLTPMQQPLMEGKNLRRMIRDRKSQHDEKTAICIVRVQLLAWGAIYGVHNVLFLCAYLRCTLSDVIEQKWLLVYKTVLLSLQKPRNSLPCHRL